MDLNILLHLQDILKVCNLLKNMYIYVRIKKSSSDPYLAILKYRNTPIKGINISPTQMLMRRRTQTQLPVNEKLLNPQYDGEKVQNALKEKRHTQKHYYDREAKTLQQLNPDDQIWVRNENKWKVKTPSSYVIQTERGQKLRRKRRHLLKTTGNGSDEPKIFYDCQQEVSNT